MSPQPASTPRGWLLAAAMRAVVLGLVAAVAVAFAAALQTTAGTPEGERGVTSWLTQVPDGWPATPWSTARFDSSWSRETWEIRGDPPTTPTGRARDFAAQWSLRCGWPLRAFECTRHRLRALWGQGETFKSPSDGPSHSWREGVVIDATRLGAAEGQFLVPLVPIWSGLLVDTMVWSVPIFVISLIASRLRRVRSTT